MIKNTEEEDEEEDEVRGHPSTNFSFSPFGWTSVFGTGTYLTSSFLKCRECNVASTVDGFKCGYPPNHITCGVCLLPLPNRSGISGTFGATTTTTNSSSTSAANDNNNDRSKVPVQCNSCKLVLLFLDFIS